MFDLIGGTSTGGCVASNICVHDHVIYLFNFRIIALMLGRLRMDVDKAIEYYDDLTEKVFSDKKRWGDGKFKATKLEEIIKSAVKDVTGDSGSPLMEGEEAGFSRTLVCHRYYAFVS